MRVLLSPAFLLVGIGLAPSDGFTFTPRIHRPASSTHCKRQCLLRLQNGKDDNDGSWVLARWKAADKLEIRLDATVVSCHTLARFLSYDMTLPPKDVPGFEIVDIVMILNTFTSAVVISLFWILAGLLTEIFEKDADDWGALFQTAFLAAPPWLILELLLGWPAADGAVIERILLGTLGLMATMSLSRAVAPYLR